MKKLTYLFFIGLIAISCHQNTSSETEQSETTETTETIEKPTVPDGVYFVFPKNGETVNNPVSVGFGVNGMEVEPAGQVNKGMGHHHIIIDGQYVESGIVVPADSTHIHFGKGQKETQLELTPGKHTLTMQFADGVHKSFGEEWSNTIEITVE